jgi:hypothetical protein
MSDLLSTRRVLVAVLVLGWFVMAARNVVDPDLWWHLKTGEYIAAHHAVPHADLFSYTRAGKPWTVHAWLSDLFIYFVFQVGGWAGLIVTFAVIVAGAFLILYERTPQKPYISGVLTLWAAWATAPLWGVRPQMLSLLLTSLWLLLLERSERKPNLLWWTLPLTLLWVNLHAGFALGLALLALFLAGEFIERTLGDAKVSFGRLRLLGITLAIDLLLVPFNPNGMKLYRYPLETLRSRSMQSYIAEWASPNFHRADYWPFLFLLLATVAAMLWSWNRLRLRDVLLLLASTASGLASVRFIPFFVLVAVPILSQAIQMRAISQRKVLRRQLPFPALLNALTLLAMAVFTAAHVSYVIERQPQSESASFPSGAVAYLQAHAAVNPIFNHYDWGGYLIWKLYPATRVFIDGRADVYGDELLQQFADTYQLRSDWRQGLEQWQIKTVIVPVDSALAVALRLDSGWSVRYEDSMAVIFLKTGS